MLCKADGCSPFPSPSHPSTHGRCHLSHPDLPRLLPLPHQGFESIYPLAYAQAHRRLPSRYEATCVQEIRVREANTPSSAPGSPRERGEGEEDSYWTFFQGSRKLRLYSNPDTTGACVLWQFVLGLDDCYIGQERINLSIEIH